MSTGVEKQNRPNNEELRQQRKNDVVKELLKKSEKKTKEELIQILTNQFEKDFHKYKNANR